jgi:hypothetical protein
MRHTTLLLALAALAATSCSLQLDSQYGLRWDRRVTVPQRAESDFSEAQPEVEPEVAPEWYAAESEPPTETAQHMAAPEAKDFEVSLPFGIQMNDLPKAAQPQIERRLEKLQMQSASNHQVKKSVDNSAASTVLKIVTVVLGICLILLGGLLFFIGYLVSFFDSDQADELYQLGILFIVLGALIILVPQILL